MPFDNVTGRQTPGPAGIRGGRAELGRPVKHLHRAVGLRRTGQRQRTCRGEAVAHGAGVRREGC